MSSLGQKQTFKRLRLMSALPPKADIRQRNCNVRFVPKADSCTAANFSLFDYFVRTLLAPQRKAMNGGGARISRS